jgi:lipoprotein-releasing system permease protein
MQLGYYIAKKLGTSKQQSFTKTITLLAMSAVSISVCVVLLAYGILLGFKQEIRQKVRGYAGDISITRYQLASGNESNIFTIDSNFLATASKNPEISRISPFLNKAAILKSDSTLEGIILKGLPYDYDFTFYEKNLLRGKIPEYNHKSISFDILLSEYTSNILEVDTGDRLMLYFIENGTVLRRRVSITGIFNSNLLEFDKQFAIADLRALQQLIDREYNKAAGYEVKISPTSLPTEIQNYLMSILDYNYAIKTMSELYPTMFQWLELVDTNVLVIIILMLVVAVINIMTVLLILIIDRIPMIGILKALGSNAQQIMSIFNWQGLFILIGGLIIGNILAGLLAFLQVNFKLIKLDADTYYMDAVPFELPLSYWVAINIGALLVCFIFTYIPVRLISKIDPSQSIRFR